MPYASLGTVVTGTAVASAWGNQVKANFDAIVADNPSAPWLVQVDLLFPESNVNFASRTKDSASMYNHWLSGTGAQNAEATWSVILGAGTWTLRLVHNTGSNAGIYSVQLDGSTVGTIDGYAASGSVDQVGTITGITVATGGKKTLKLLMATKNASSSNYMGIVQYVQLHRTA